MHHGPTFGAIDVFGFDIATLEAGVHDDLDDGMTAAGLRKLAADAIKAAEWMEAHR